MQDNSTFFQYFKQTLSFKLIITIIVMFVLVILADKLIMPWYVSLGNELELPDVVELTAEEAGHLLSKQGFSVVLMDSIYDPNYPKGTIVEQSPYPFAKVKKGRHVYLTVSIGKKPIIMPNLFYKSPRDAELILKSYGLQLNSRFYEWNDIAVEGVVVGQSYPQGQKIKKGSAVDLTISLGPFPKQRLVPSLVGTNLQSARKQLKTLGVKSIKIEYEEKESILPNTVLKQSLKPGSPIEMDTEIEITISKLKASE